MRAGIGEAWTDFIVPAGGARHQPLHWRLLDGASVDIPGSQAPLEREPRPAGQAATGQCRVRALPCAATSGAGPCAKARSRGRAHQRYRARYRAGPAPADQPDHRQCRNDPHPARRSAGGGIQQLCRRHRHRRGAPAGADRRPYRPRSGRSRRLRTPRRTRSTLPTSPGALSVSLGCVRASAGSRSMRPSQPTAFPLSANSAACCRSCSTCRQCHPLFARGLARSGSGPSSEGERARITVADQGEGLSEEEQAKVFEKFERLGRSGDGGSGLGLYISRRLARGHGRRPDGRKRARGRARASRSSCPASRNGAKSRADLQIRKRPAFDRASLFRCKS